MQRSCGLGKAKKQGDWQGGPWKLGLLAPGSQLLAYIASLNVV